MQQDVPAPQALVQISRDFETSATGEGLKRIRPGSVCNMCFRLLDLRADIKSGEITDPTAILEAAEEINHDLEAWRKTLPLSWDYVTVDAGDAPAGTYFQGKRHIYSSPWTAQVWNNWRTLRILVNRIILQIEVRSGALDSADASTALFLIHQMYTEISISAANCEGCPRKQFQHG